MKKSKIVLMISMLTLLCVSMIACNNTDLGYNPQETTENKPLIPSNTDLGHNPQETTENKPLIPSNADYSIKLVSGQEHIFNIHRPSEPEEITKIETFDNPVKATVSIGRQKVAVYKKKTRTTGNNILTEYHSENGDIVYLVMSGRNDSERNYFVVSSKSGFALSRYTASEKSEKNMLALVKNYISTFIDMKDIDDDYVYSCTTAVIVTYPVIPSTWKEFKAGYYVPKNDSANEEEVSYYEFSFDKYHNGYKTGDRISVRCSSTGDIENLIYSNYGVDWSCFPINEDKLNNKIASYLHNKVSDEYEIIEYELIDDLLTYDSDEKQAKLRLTYKVTVEKNGEKIETKCLMVVSCK